MGWTDTGVCLTHPEGQETAGRLVATLAAQGVERAWVFGYGAVQSHDFAGENANVLAAAAAHPATLVPVALVNPFTAAREVDGLIESGFKAVKVLTGWGNWLTIENIRNTLVPVARRLAASKLHMSIALEGNLPLRGGSVYLPLLVREACPECVLVLDHCWSQYSWLDYLAIAEEDASLWFALHELPPRMIRDIVERIGIDRLVLSSWFPEHAPGLIFDRVASALGMDAGALADALSRNAARVLEGQHAASLART